MKNVLVSAQKVLLILMIYSEKIADIARDKFLLIQYVKYDKKLNVWFQSIYFIWTERIRRKDFNSCLSNKRKESFTEAYCCK